MLNICEQKKNVATVFLFLGGKRQQNEKFHDIWEEEYDGQVDKNGEFSKQLLMHGCLTLMIKRISLDIHEVYERGGSELYDDSYKTDDEFQYNKMKRTFMGLFNDFGEDVMNGMEWNVMTDEAKTDTKLVKMDSSKECSYKIFCDYYMLYFNQLENAREIIMCSYLNQRSLRERGIPMSNIDSIYSNSIREYMGLYDKVDDVTKSLNMFIDLMDNNKKKAKAEKNKKKRLVHKAKLAKAKSDKKIKDMLDMARNGIIKRKMFEKKRIVWCNGGCGGCVGCGR